ncbi:hypothetical protein [Leucobacter luti]|uniref:hypothetical protein n=1 Tax=Leucobacter luti TaxID=340320 RepID=UPI003CFD139E
MREAENPGSTRSQKWLFSTWLCAGCSTVAIGAIAAFFLDPFSPSLVILRDVALIVIPACVVGSIVISASPARAIHRVAATIGVLGILAASTASVLWIHALDAETDAPFGAATTLAAVVMLSTSMLLFLHSHMSRGPVPAILTRILLGAASVGFGLAVVLLAYLPCAAAALALSGLVYSMVKHRGITAGA